jgi:hypothetical protein
MVQAIGTEAHISWLCSWKWHRGGRLARGPARKRQCRTALSFWLPWILLAPPGMALQKSAARVWGNNQSLREAQRVEKVLAKLVS